MRISIIKITTLFVLLFIVASCDSEAKNIADFLDYETAKIDTLSWSPRVFHYHGFLSEEECNHIIKLGTLPTQLGYFVFYIN